MSRGPLTSRWGGGPAGAASRVQDTRALLPLLSHRPAPSGLSLSSWPSLWALGARAPHPHLAHTSSGPVPSAVLIHVISP